MKSVLRNALPVLAATTAAQALVSLGMLAPSAVAPEMGRGLDLPPALVGVWISLAYGGAMASSLAGTGAVRRFGAARTTQAALALVAAGMAATALAWLPGVVAGAALVGLGYGLTNPAAAHLLSRAAAGTGRNLIFSIKQSGVPLGGTLAGLAAPPLAVLWGWPAAMLAVAIVCALLALALQPVRAGWDSDRLPQAPMEARPVEGLRLILADRRLGALSAAGFSFAVVQLSLSTFLVTMLVADLGWTLVDAGLVLAALQVSGVLGRPALGWVADRIGSGTATLAGIGVATALLAVAASQLGPGWPAALVLALIVPLGAAALGWNGIYLAEVAHAAPAGAVSRVTGASLFFTFGGVLVGPPAFALLHGLTGSYTATYALLAVPALAGAWLLARAGRAA